MARPSVLLVGFDPFNGAASNPSGAAVALVAEHWTGEAILHTARLPTVFADSQRIVRSLIAETKPDLVIAVGLANGRAAITPERVAINLNDARIPDNAGDQPRDLPVVAGGPDAYFSTFPVKALVAALRHASIPAAVSYSAGTFVCNHVFYTIMHELAVHHPHAKGGFIHVPASPAESADGSTPTLPMSMIAEALRIAIQTCLAPTDPLEFEAGTLA